MEESLGGINVADFCKQCSEKLFGEDTKELAEISTPQDTEAGFYVAVICETCGPIFVNHLGHRVGYATSNRRVMRLDGDE